MERQHTSPLRPPSVSPGKASTHLNGFSSPEGCTAQGVHSKLMQTGHKDAPPARHRHHGRQPPSHLGCYRAGSPPLHSEQLDVKRRPWSSELLRQKVSQRACDINHSSQCPDKGTVMASGRQGAAHRALLTVLLGKPGVLGSGATVSTMPGLPALLPSSSHQRQRGRPRAGVGGGWQPGFSPRSCKDRGGPTPEQGTCSRAGSPRNVDPAVICWE